MSGICKEDDIFSHVVAIDFGTGASGYINQYINIQKI